MDQRELLLQSWCAQLIEAFELDGTTIDIDAVLALAGKAAHSVVRPAAPLTTFIAGYAAGLAVGTGQANEDVAMRSAVGLATAQCPPEGGDTVAGTASVEKQ